jgi:hypothetical protein
MERYHCTITFTEPLLGTVAKGEKPFATACEAQGVTPETDELETVPPIEDKPATGFHQYEGNPCLMNYMIKGLFKDTTGFLRKVRGTHSAHLQAYKKLIDGLIFVYPRYIPIQVEGEMGTLERPIRAQTPRGERVAIARSDFVPAGSRIEFELKVLDVITEETLREWLDYGADHGLGQWRNGGYGVFKHTLTRIE